jgi:hypothetical protein
MAETLLFIGIGALLLVVGAATLVIAALILRNARKSVELAEGRVKHLQEEQALLAFLREELRGLKEELERERERHLEAERRAERLKQECLVLRQDQGQLVEELEHEHERYLEARRQAERLGQERLLLRHEHNQLKEELKQERERHLEKHLEAQQRTRQEHEGWEREREQRLEAEERVERLSQERLLLQQEHNRLKEELKQERERHLEAGGRAERLSQERVLLRQEQGQVAEELEQERAKRLEAQQRAWQEREGRERERRVRREAERRAAHLEQELQELREVRQESSSPVLEGLPEDLVETRELLGEKSLPGKRSQGRTRRPAGSLEPRIPETAASQPAENPPEDERSRPGQWVPHPDDDEASREKAPAKRARARSDTPIKIDHKHYDKYLENYQGYVELAEKLYRAREKGEVPSGTPAESKWEKSLRRVKEGIERTTAKLDMLEQRNPELATDDRISRRAGIARRQSRLEK